MVLTPNLLQLPARPLEPHPPDVIDEVASLAFAFARHPRVIAVPSPCPRLVPVFASLGLGRLLVILALLTPFGLCFLPARSDPTLLMSSTRSRRSPSPSPVTPGSSPSPLLALAWSRCSRRWALAAFLSFLRFSRLSAFSDSCLGRSSIMAARARCWEAGAMLMFNVLFSPSHLLAPPSSLLAPSLPVRLRLRRADFSQSLASFSAISASSFAVFFATLARPGVASPQRAAPSCPRARF